MVSEKILKITVPGLEEQGNPDMRHEVPLVSERIVLNLLEVTGAKLSESFVGKDLDIRIFDQSANVLHVPYAIENGSRIEIESYELPEKGFSAYVIWTRSTLLVNEGMDQAMLLIGSSTFPGTPEEKSGLYVPLVAEDKVFGLIAVIDNDHENAFSEGDVRLVEKLAGEISAALMSAI